MPGVRPRSVWYAPTPGFKWAEAGPPKHATCNIAICIMQVRLVCARDTRSRTAEIRRRKEGSLATLQSTTMRQSPSACPAIDRSTVGTYTARPVRIAGYLGIAARRPSSMTSPATAEPAAWRPQCSCRRVEQLKRRLRARRGRELSLSRRPRGFGSESSANRRTSLSRRCNTCALALTQMAQKTEHTPTYRSISACVCARVCVCVCMCMCVCVSPARAPALPCARTHARSRARALQKPALRSEVHCVRSGRWACENPCERRK